jgi:5,6-dimethylbenzimidazole synthase
MDLFSAIKERRSCRQYLPEPIPEEILEKILEAATWAPSPLNAQPWEFLVVTNSGLKEKIFEEADRCRKWALEISGWKWLDRYQVDFLKSAPALVVVTGDPKKSGVDMFLEEGHIGYQAACAAAIQNMLLAAQALGIGSLWFTLYDKKILREILGLDPEKTPVGIICLGKPDGPLPSVPRKALTDKITFLR